MIINKREANLCCPISIMMYDILILNLKREVKCNADLKIRKEVMKAEQAIYFMKKSPHTSKF